jgi:transketolase
MVAARVVSESPTAAVIREKARMARVHAARLMNIAKSGHYGSAYSCVEILATLYYGGLLRVRPAEPKWPGRDRLVLSKGHAAVVLYPMLADLGFFPASALDNYARLGSAFGDHPDMRRVAGVDFSSGSLGHGLSICVGMALALRAQDSRVFCVLGDGELNEGQVWAAAMSASNFRLENLVAIVDRNGVSVDGPTEEVMRLEPLEDKWRAFGWATAVVDGHDPEALLPMLSAHFDVPAGRPLVVIARTVSGKGISFIEGQFEWHMGHLSAEDEQRAFAELETGGRLDG